MQEFLENVKHASRTLRTIDTKTKNLLLEKMADALESNSKVIIEKNSIDYTYAQENNIDNAMLDRLLLDEKRVKAMAASLRQIASLTDPVGKILDGWVNEDGLQISKISVPIGVIGIIYESRPNVTSDAAALCFKSGNGCVLKGGKEAQESNAIIASVMQKVLEENGLEKNMISLLPDSSREGVAKLIKEDKYVDLIIPRGGSALIKYVNDNATVPVIKHDKGLCHTYIDEKADEQKAIKIALNAKVQRPGVCNAMETLLVDYAIADSILPKLKIAFDDAHTELKGCDITAGIIAVDDRAGEDEFNTEYLANILNIKVVNGVHEAINHISQYGSGHSEAIITENYTTAQRFLNEVDSATVYVNASTRFTDGGAFGFGAEVGISTNKLHARGPMGISELTTYKFIIRGDGHIRK